MREGAVEERKDITVRVEVDGIVVQRRAQLRVLEYDNTGRATVSCMTPVLEEGEILCERLGMIQVIIRAPAAAATPLPVKPAIDPVRYMQVTIYRDHIIRTVFGKRPAMAFKEFDADALSRLCERLADAEDAKRIMRNKGYGQPWESLVELARLLPDAPPKPSAFPKR